MNGISSLKLRSQSVALTHDILMVPIAWFLAFWLRYNLGSLTPQFFNDFFSSLLIVLPIQAAAFFLFGLYKGVWRFASLPDIFRIIKAVGMGAVIATVALFIFSRADGIPRSVPVIYALALVMLLGGPRLIYRWLKDRHIYLSTGKRVLIVGAGKAGEMLVRDILRDPLKPYQPVAFVDDNPRCIGSEIHGLPILGRCDRIPEIVNEYGIAIIMLAIPSAKSSEIQRIVSYCEKSKASFRSVPQLPDLVSGKVSINSLREVSIEDLLGRDPVTLDWPAIESRLSKRRILITGGGGSIGSELCRQIAKITPSELIILDSSEFNLYTIEMEIEKHFPGIRLRCYLGDVTDSSYVTYVFEQTRPQIVFHAAAYKHVPMLEPQIRQAMRNNVLGTKVVAEVADKSGCEEFVMVSTDKAVNPANIMGASKRAAEIFCQNLNARSQTKYITVRFGNVLGSAGSVIPLFRKQIACGGPVTVTDSRMERFFMTIPEATQLIMQTVVLGKGGEIFVLDMGGSVKISYLAEQMIRLSGMEPGVDIEITYTGLRPGEKLFEELFHEKEHLEGTAHEKVLLAQHREVDWIWLNRVLDNISEACVKMDQDRLLAALSELVPEYGVSQKSYSDRKGADIVYLKN